MKNFKKARQRRLLKERAIAYKGSKCEICKYDRCPAAMVFHHRDPEIKDFEISTRTNWDDIQRELDYCSLLCANCHAEVHAGWHPTMLETLDRDRAFYPYDE